MKLDEVLARTRKELYRKGVLDNLNTTDFIMSKHLDLSDTSIRIYRSKEKATGKDVVPYGKIVKAAMKHKLDLNYIFDIEIN